MKLWQSAKDGARIGFENQHKSTRCKNWPSSYQHRSAIDDFITSNSSLLRVEGPFTESDLPPGFKSSPLGAFTKPKSHKIRIIHDLSYPPNDSCNDGIDKEMCRVDYTSVDHAVSILNQFDSPPFMVKCDLSSAFNSVLVHKDDRHLLGFSWPNADGSISFYNMAVMPFGLASAPRIFSEITDFIEWVIQQKVPGKVIHYLDDFWACALTYEDAMLTLNVIIDTCKQAGFEIQDSKTCFPSHLLEFLGIIINSVNRTLSISEERVQDILSELKHWSYKRTVTKRELLSLIGKLMFCSKVVQYGKLFVRRLIHLSKKAKKLHHKIRITPQAHADIAWWITCMEAHNATAWFPQSFNVWSADIIFTDASDLAAGICYENAWTIFTFDQQNSWMAGMSIAWRELFAVVLAIATYGPCIAGKDLIMNIDNQAICYCINSAKSKDPYIMNLVRALYYYTSVYHINYRAIHISTHDNWGADALSRLDVDTFKRFNPNSEDYMTQPQPVLINF